MTDDDHYDDDDDDDDDGGESFTVEVSCDNPLRPIVHKTSGGGRDPIILVKRASSSSSSSKSALSIQSVIIYMDSQHHLCMILGNGVCRIFQQ